MEFEFVVEATGPGLVGINSIMPASTGHGTFISQYLCVAKEILQDVTPAWCAWSDYKVLRQVTELWVYSAEISVTLKEAEVGPMSEIDIRAVTYPFTTLGPPLEQDAFEVLRLIWS